MKSNLFGQLNAGMIDGSLKIQIILDRSEKIFLDGAKVDQGIAYQTKEVVQCLVLQRFSDSFLPTLSLELTTSGEISQRGTKTKARSCIRG